MGDEDAEVHRLRPDDAEDDTAEDEFLDMLEDAERRMGYFELGPIDATPAIPMRWKVTPGMSLSIGVTFTYPDDEPAPRS